MKAFVISCVVVAVTSCSKPADPPPAKEAATAPAPPAAPAKPAPPPFDIAAGEAALFRGAWHGKLGEKPAELTAARKAGKLTAKLVVGKAASEFTGGFEKDGALVLAAEPRPTSSGLVTINVRLTFTDAKLRALGGTLEFITKQGFVEQASSSNLTLEDTSPEKTATR